MSAIAGAAGPAMVGTPGAQTQILSQPITDVVGNDFNPVDCLSTQLTRSIDKALNPLIDRQMGSEALTPAALQTLWFNLVEN